MKVDYDEDTDIMMIELSEEKIDHAEKTGNFIVHLSEGGKPVLLEIMDFGDLLPKLGEATENPRSGGAVRTSGAAE